MVFGENQRCLRTKYKIPADIMPAGTNHKHIRGTTLITSQADKLLASIKAFADNGASRTLLLPCCLRKRLKGDTVNRFAAWRRGSERSSGVIRPYFYYSLSPTGCSLKIDDKELSPSLHLWSIVTRLSPLVKRVFEESKRNRGLERM